MAQESTMICVDNSEWMRNGDLQPTRFNSQQEAVRALIHYKLHMNPENDVGLLSLANHIEVHNSLMTDERKLILRLHSLEINGSTKVLAGMKTAYLALRYRKNKNHKQHIVVFIGSPLDNVVEEKDSFLKFAKKLKKEKVSADFVLFGEATSEKNQLVAEFIDIINGADGTGSHLLVVPAGDAKLYDALLHSPICQGATATAAMAPGAGGEFGINEEDDPELAMVLRMSLEEQRLRQQHQDGGAQQQPAQEENQQEEAPMDVDVPSAAVRPPTPAAQPPPNFESMTEEQQMAYALRLSMEQGDQQDSRSRSPSMNMSTPAPTPMEAEECGPASGSGPVGELLNDPERLKELVAQQGQQAGNTKNDQPKTSKSNEDDKSDKDNK